MQEKQQKYKKLSKLGEGTYGTVYKAQDSSTGLAVALKKMKIEDRDEGTPVTALREIALLRTLNHPGIVRLLEIIYETEANKTKLYMVLEFVPETLGQYIARCRPIAPFVVRTFVYQLLKIEEYLISKAVIHRDLKPSNILVTVDGKIKLCDFGLAKRFELPMAEMTPRVGTLWYRAPEILLGGKHYTVAAEMWAIGCITAEMAEGKPLFRNSTEIGQIFDIFNALGTPTMQEYPQLQKLQNFAATFPRFKPTGIATNYLGQLGADFLLGLLTINPDHRLTVREALSHPYLQGCS